MSRDCARPAVPGQVRELRWAWTSLNITWSVPIVVGLDSYSVPCTLKTLGQAVCNDPTVRTLAVLEENLYEASNSGTWCLVLGLSNALHTRYLVRGVVCWAAT